MKPCLMSRSPLLVSAFLRVFACACVVHASAADKEPKTRTPEQEPAVFRPEAGQFPPLEKAHAYRGELVFVDHANRRGSLRVMSSGAFRFNAPHPFALLPCAVVRYHGAPADLRDIPLGTVLHVRAFLPPDPTTSAVPVLPVDNRNKTAGYSGKGVAPAENHVLLLEDEFSHCQREGRVWKLREVEIQNRQGRITAICEAPQGGGIPAEETLTLDAATRFWRGREVLRVEHLVAEGIWPAEGKKALGDPVVLLGLTWKPTPGGVFTRLHVSDIWLDAPAMQNATQQQTEVHKAFMRSRWLPAWVDAVEYGKFGRAIVTATLFGGMDASLYADFKKDITVTVNAAENTLKHAGGNYGPAHMASKGAILEVVNAAGEVPLGSSGLQVRFETDLIIEGIRPGRVIRLRPANWPLVNLPREEYLGDGNFSHEDRFPTPAIFPKY